MVRVLVYACGRRNPRQTLLGGAYQRDDQCAERGQPHDHLEEDRAEAIAHQAVGTSGKVANELTVKNVDSRTADDMDGAIRKELNAKVENDRAQRKKVKPRTSAAR